jgi:2-deoxy-D-gluconate 3-dehydrogenase
MRRVEMDKGFFRLDGKTALITGAATGLGQAVAMALAKAGADTIITDKPGVSLDDTLTKVAEFGHNITDYPMDVRDIEQIRKVVNTVAEKLGKIDILVNNAGINRPAPGLEVSAENWENHFNTNVRGGFFAAQAAAPYMIKNGWGRIIFISSQSGLIGIPGQPVYCATKGAVIQLVRTLGVEWAKHGITVNSIAPTFIETNLTRLRRTGISGRYRHCGGLPCQ